MWKEVTMDYWTHFPSIFQKVLRKTTKKFVIIVGVPVWIQTCYYPNASRKALQLVSSPVLGADIIKHLRSPNRQSRSSTFDEMNTLRTAKSWNVVRFPAEQKDCCPVQSTQTGYGSNPESSPLV
jgi:hypothetical protein